jgi:hypothetical protein
MMCDLVWFGVQRSTHFLCVVEENGGINMDSESWWWSLG